MQDGSSGQLNYEAPTLRIMNKEYTEFEDLQKTLAQIGVNSGNILINLRYSKKDKPLYVAMEEIGRFFQDFDGETTPTPSQPKAEQPPQSPVQVPLPATLSVQQQASPKQASPPRPSPPRMTPQATESSSSHLNRPRNLEVHAAPTSTTPLATQTGFDEDAYVPTIADAKRHQAALENRGKNQRLLSDAEIAALEAEKLAKKKSVIETKVRIRFPDETMVTLTVSISDTGADLYTFVRDLLEPNKQRERFWLVYRGKRPNERLEDGKVSLIGDLGWSGPTLVNFVWDDSASAGARKGPALKEEHRRDAKPVEVPKAGLGETAGSGSGRSGASPGPSTEAASAKPKDERSKEEKLRTLLGKGKGLFGKK